jgi:hypothetical protein
MTPRSPWSYPLRPMTLRRLAWDVAVVAVAVVAIPLWMLWEMRAGRWLTAPSVAPPDAWSRRRKGDA